MLTVQGTGNISFVRLAKNGNDEWLEIEIISSDLDDSLLKVFARSKNGLYKAHKDGAKLQGRQVAFHGSADRRTIRDHYVDQEGVMHTLKMPEMRLRYAVVERLGKPEVTSTTEKVKTMAK